ncbi:MAG TPA: protein kinase [Thermoanaerobaculia bacterium]|nr:protein kinase [Thermoanaerobaculia bacterium]
MSVRETRMLARLAAMRFKNEADVQRYFIPPLLELLGYQLPEDAPAESPLDFRIVSAGRDRIQLKRPDFLVRAKDRWLFVIETKAPAEKFTELDVEQALSYARHETIRAPLTMLANGRRITVLESDTRHRKLDFAHDDLASHYRELQLLLSKQTLGSAIDGGHLHLLRKIGKGAFGVVYEAMNMRVKRTEAVKIYTFTDADRERRRRRFRQGTVAHARLAHPNVAAFYGLVEYGSELAVRMQFIDGEPLQSWLRKAKPAARERVLLIAEIAETIAFAHEHGVIHRDLKPSNIMVVAEKAGVRPVIVDFDTAVVLGESTITRSAERLGSFGYIDPEMLDLRPGKELRDPRSDVYSLGRLLEFVLTGQHPRSGRSMRDLETRIRKAARELTRREQNLVIEVLLPATAEHRHERTQTAAAFASDLHAIFDERIDADLDAKQYAQAVFHELDALVAAQRLPFAWQNLTSEIRPDEFGRYSPLPRFGELDVLFDEGFYSFYAGVLIGDEKEFARFRASRELRALRESFGDALRLDPIAKDEDGAASLVIRYFDVRRQTPRQTAEQLAEVITRFLAVLDPPNEGVRPVVLAPPRDIIDEMQRWPSRSFRARGAFKKLSKEVREATDFPAALLPFLHLLWPDAKQTPELRRDGIDILAGTPATIAMHCSESIEEARDAVESFRRSSWAMRDFVVILRREEQTVAYREALRLSLERLVAEGKAARVHVWNHRDDVVYAAFQLMHERVLQELSRWNAAMLDEQSRIERTLGAVPIRNVPFTRGQMRIDATSLWSESERRAEVADVTQTLLAHEDRRLHVLLGTAGFGKTTSVMRAAREGSLQWLVIPAARLRPDSANAQALFETALDFERLLAGASAEDRPVWQRIVGPVLKYLTQFESGIGVIVDALDESVTIGRSYGLHTFFNFFRRTMVPVIVTMRSEFWTARRADFTPGRSVVESTVQTLDVLELQPWTDAQILEAARLRYAETRAAEARERIRTFLAEVESGSYARFYGDIPRTPLFLRFILDVLDRRDSRNMTRRTLFRYWAEQKIARDVEAPRAKGGVRLPIRATVTSAAATIATAMQAMTEAAFQMTAVRDGVVELLPSCSFESIREAMHVQAPDSAESLALNSLLITTSDAEPRLRFAHRVFQEFFTAEAADRFADARLPREVEAWQLA